MPCKNPKRYLSFRQNYIQGTKLKKKSSSIFIFCNDFEGIEPWQNIPNADVLCSEDNNSFEVRISSPRYNYKDCNYDLDEYFYEYEFNSIREEKE